MTEASKTEQAKREIAEEYGPLPSDFREYERELYDALLAERVRNLELRELVEDLQAELSRRRGGYK